MNFSDNPLARIIVAVALSIIFFSIIVVFLPESDLPSGVTDSFEWLINGLYSFDFMLPINTMIFCFTTIISLEVIFFSVRAFMWLKKHLTQQH
jgi:hypothetical protein